MLLVVIMSQARIKLLRQLCGMPTLPPPIEKPDISRSNMEFLKLELERLAAEKVWAGTRQRHACVAHTLCSSCPAQPFVCGKTCPGWLLCRAAVAVPLRRRLAGVASDFICCCVVPCCVPAQEQREDLIRRQLDDLGALCADLGEEVKAAVMEVHPNLVYMWDAEAARVLRDVYRLGSSYNSTVGGMVDLGDTTISRLGSKILVMKDLKVGPAGCRHETHDCGAAVLRRLFL